jgi:hypothetical protein
MPLPKSIEAAAARSEEIQRQMGTPVIGQTPEPNQQQQQTPVTPAAQAVQTTEKTDPVEPSPTPAIADWEQKFKVLNGKYSAEVPRLHGEIKELKTQLATAMSEIGELKTRTPAVSNLNDLTPEEREQYDAGFLEVVAKVARANAQAPVAQTADTELAARLARVEQEVEETKEDKFFRELDSASSDWKTLNTNAGFLAWLAEDDGFSGRTRQELFNDAYNRLDVSRVARFFNSFGGGDQSNVSRTSTVPSLEQQVVPRPNGSAPAPMPGKPIYNARDIAEFYAAVRRGQYKGNEAEQARVEQDIFAAQREGRVK